ncbi:MAG: TlpA family protein disulfide reductase [Balneolaceae bacterium]|nr:TlpA family protein disulfide reductase [Balneolaceae bacterium]
MKPLVTILVLFLWLGCTPSPTGNSVGETPNTPAPDFTHNSLDGGEFTLSDFRGRVVYLFFYGAGCPHCRSNGPVTETSIHQRFASNPDFVALGLDTWNLSASDNQSFRNVTGITYPLLLQAQQSLVNYYGTSSAYDRSVVVNRNGTIVYQGSGFVNTDVDAVVSAIENALSELGE